MFPTKVTICIAAYPNKSTTALRAAPGHLGPMWMSLCRCHALFTWQLVERIPALRLEVTENDFMEEILWCFKGYPLVNIQKTIENGHSNSGVSH